MDPFSAEGELVNIHTAFVQGQYTSVLNDYTPDTFSAENHLPVRVLQGRASCALGDHKKVATSISDSEAKSTPDLAALKTYATYLSSNSTDEIALAAAEKLVESHSDNLSVQLLCGTVLARAGKTDAALALLAKHTGSLDAVALAVQLHLANNRTDLAVKEAKGARSFAQDALLVNLAEAWIGMGQGGENYQKSYYVFEELAQAPSSSSATSLVAQAVSELHLGRLEEAEVALNQALTLEPDNASALANKILLETLQGKDVSEARQKLGTVDKEHGMLVDYQAKKDAFQVALGKYSPKFEP